MKDTKQVIVIRRDLKCRRGKEIAQGSHASMSFLTERIADNDTYAEFELSEAEQSWLSNGFRKITCQVETEKELLDIHQKALDAGLESHIILDSGHTEFNGVPTYTAVAIGPDWSDKVDEVTKELKLY